MARKQRPRDPDGCWADTEDPDSPHYVDPDPGDEDLHDARIMFRDPGGRSALRAASKHNPRNLPCPTCGQPDKLTPADKAAGYQCDDCADGEEGP